MHAAPRIALCNWHFGPGLDQSTAEARSVFRFLCSLPAFPVAAAGVLVPPVAEYVRPGVCCRWQTNQREEKDDT